MKEEIKDQCIEFEGRKIKMQIKAWNQVDPILLIFLKGNSIINGGWL